MDNKKFTIIKLLLLPFLLLTSLSALAQQSILSEISFLYLEKIVATAKENYPRVRNLTSQVNIAKSDLSAAKISWLEPFSFQYVARSNEANINAVNLTTADILTGYQFGISFNPGSLFAKPGNIRKAKEQVKIAQSNQDEYFLQLESMVKTRYITYIRTQKSLVPVNNAFLDAENNFKAIKIKYQRGEATFLEFNSASSSFNQAFENKLQVEANYLSAKISLEELTVKRIEDIK